jgi:cytochrome c oxidase assembly factor CtaG
MLPYAQAACTAAIVLAAALYLRGWLHLRTASAIPISVWRAISFLLGLVAIWAAVASRVAISDRSVLTAHMIQHLLLMTIAPPMIWLGSPLPAVWNGLPRPVQNAALPVIRQAAAARIGRAITRPAFCWMAAAAALVVWHVPAIFKLGMQSETWHAIEQASFLATGLLFWWPVIQPVVRDAAEPRWAILVYLFLATLPCDVLSGLLVFSDRVAYPVYLCTPQRDGFSALEDQQCAGALMWTCVTVVYLVAGTILAMQLLSPRSDHAEDPSGAAPRPSLSGPRSRTLRSMAFAVLPDPAQCGAEDDRTAAQGGSLHDRSFGAALCRELHKRIRRNT